MDSILNAIYWSLSVLIFILAFTFFMLMDSAVENRYTYVLHNNSYSEITKK